MPTGTSKQDTPIWAEIDLSAIAYNVRQLRHITSKRARLLAAVKANGYGHGALEVARTALQNGATDLGVARMEEAIHLRENGVTAPILIFGYTPSNQAVRLLQHRLVPSISSLAHARELSNEAQRLNRLMPIHIKVDSGMGRLGLPCDALRIGRSGSAVPEITAIAGLKGLDLQGIFTHFATADNADKTYARQQFAHFQQLLNQLEKAGLPLPVCHAANSGAIIEMPETHLDMVRAGIAVYGLYPSGEVDQSRVQLKPALSLKARIVHLKQVPPRTCISYGCTYRTAADAVIATVPAGYGDGYSRLLSNRGTMLVNGRRAPIRGRVCMDLTMIDVTGAGEVRVDDEVILLGRQGHEQVTADEIAQTLGTISYEVVTALMDRVPRVYLNRSSD